MKLDEDVKVKINNYKLSIYYTNIFLLFFNYSLFIQIFIIR
jgi:hypothetical protein